MLVKFTNVLLLLKINGEMNTVHKTNNGMNHFSVHVILMLLLVLDLGLVMISVIKLMISLCSMILKKMVNSILVTILMEII